jgi:signal transduction histidine kinase/CheY-like chemotaxis protein
MARRGTSLQRRLLVLVAVALLPFTLFAGIGISWFSHQQRHEMEQATIETMRAMMSAIDAELSRHFAALEVLAASSPLERGDMRSFHAEARRAVAARPTWVTVSLSDREGAVLLDVARPFGGPVPAPVDRRSLQRVVEGRARVIGEVAISDITKRPAFSLSLPIILDGQVAYVLTTVVSPRAMLGAIERQRVPANAVVSILDHRGLHVARSRAHQRFLGLPVSDTLRALMRDKNEGWGPSVTLEGQPIYAAFSRSPETGWMVAVGLPRDEIDLVGRRTYMAFGFGLLLSILIGATAAGLLARRIIRPMAELRAAALAVEGGKVPKPPYISIPELQEVSEALERAVAAREEAERAQLELLSSEREARTTAESANRAKDEFLAMLGHELRNPLGAMASSVRLLEADRKGSERAERPLHVMRRQLDHLTRLVDDLLDVGRLMTGRISLERKPIDLALATENAIAMLEAAGRLGSHRVTVDLEQVWVLADATRLEQVLANLLVNAAKYTPDDGRISVRVRRHENHALVEVKDSGVGIGPELLPRIFDLFTQGERSLDRSEGGLGIGLTLAQRLVKLHEGNIVAESDGPGLGSRFTVKLPAIEAPEVEQSVSAPTTPKAHRILIVEDNVDSREMLREWLEMSGHQVSEAADGTSGLEAALKERPDVALIDVGLPGIDGYEMARRVRAALGEERMILIALTGYGSAEDRRRSKAAGFDAHLVKPLNPSLLDKVLVGEPVN